MGRIKKKKHSQVFLQLMDQVNINLGFKSTSCKKNTNQSSKIETPK